MLPKNIAPLQPLHTLQTDTAEALTKESVSKVHIIAEQEKAKIKEREMIREENVAASTPSHFLRNILITVILIVILGGAGYAIFAGLLNKTEEVPQIAIPVTPDEELIAFNSMKEINFSDEEFLNREIVSQKLFSEARADSGEVTFFKLNISLHNLLSTLSPSMPDEYQRALGEKSFFGGVAENNFIIIEVDSYERAFGAQLEWENTMKEDLFPLFGISSSSSVSRFEDRIVANRDTRAALDQSGKTLFLYGFYQNDALIFARNEETFRLVYEMLLRQNL